MTILWILLGAVAGGAVGYGFRYWMDKPRLAALDAVAVHLEKTKAVLAQEREHNAITETELTEAKDLNRMLQIRFEESRAELADKVQLLNNTETLLRNAQEDLTAAKSLLADKSASPVPITPPPASAKKSATRKRR